jgi:hypothetical protein
VIDDPPPSPTRSTLCAPLPATAKRDLDIVTTLGRNFGHINLGVYAEVVVRGETAVGDARRPGS